MNESTENVTTATALVPAELILAWYNIVTWWPEAIWIYCFAFVCNILVGLPINVWVLWLIVRGPEGALASEVFTLNLAVLELIFCLFAPIAVINCFVFSSVLSDIVSFLINLVLIGRPVFQCCTCFERYLAVLHPLIFLRYRPLRYRAGCSAVVWMITLGGCSALRFIKNYVLTPAVLGFMILLLSGMSFCCLAILRALRCPGPGEGLGKGQGSRPHLDKKKAIRIILVSLVFTLACFLPIIAVAILQGLVSNRIFVTAYVICFSISVICTFVQPLFFLSRAGKLQCIMGH